MSFQVKKYTDSIREDVLNLLRLNSPTYFSATEEKDFIEYLDKEIEDYFIIVDNERILGAAGINYFPNQKVARLSWDMAHPKFQGKGIGKLLTQHRIAVIKARSDIQTIIVRTSQMAHPFYNKMGFQLEKTEKNFWSPGFDLYQMEMAL